MHPARPLLAATVFALAACAGPPEVATTTFAPSLGVDLATFTRLDSGLYLRDLDGGSGEPVHTGQVVTALYQGWLADGTSFGADTSAGYRFTLGAGQVIEGWDQGLPGMRVGGERVLLIPPSLGYGSTGVGPIPPDAVLVFEVILKSSP